MPPSGHCLLVVMKRWEICNYENGNLRYARLHTLIEAKRRRTGSFMMGAFFIRFTHSWAAQLCEEEEGVNFSLSLLLHIVIHKIWMIHTAFSLENINVHLKNEDIDNCCFFDTRWTRTIAQKKNCSSLLSLHSALSSLEKRKIFGSGNLWSQ